MIMLSFFLIFGGLCTVTAGVLLTTLHIAGAGKWPGLNPRSWDKRLKKLALLTGVGLLLTLLGFLAGYFI